MGGSEAQEEQMLFLYLRRESGAHRAARLPGQVQGTAHTPTMVAGPGENPPVPWKVNQVEGFLSFCGK